MSNSLRHHRTKSKNNNSWPFRTSWFDIPLCCRFKYFRI
uniref:Uncharacterized protein n=1 Tax=Anguilla anguilla TaxID=7936 RepID=A0A0E9U4B0_ANGAN